MEWLLCLSSQPVWPRQSRRLDCPKSLDCKELSEQALEVAEIGLLEPLTQLEVWQGVQVKVCVCVCLVVCAGRSTRGVGWSSSFRSDIHEKGSGAVFV